MAGRKIRSVSDGRSNIDGNTLSKFRNDEEMTFEQASKSCENESVTFKQACEIGLIKPGMVVIFNNQTEREYILPKEKLGFKQTIKMTLSSGIVVSNIDDTYSVLVFLENTFGSDGLIIQGRYGYAYGETTINEIISEVFQSNQHIIPKIISYAEFEHYVNYSYLASSFFSDMLHRSIFLDLERFKPKKENYNRNVNNIFHLDWEKRRTPLLEQYLNFDILLKCDLYNCTISFNKSEEEQQTSLFLPSYSKNPFEYRIEVNLNG